MPETQKQNDGNTYRNVTAEAKNQVAQTLDQFRGNYAYNLTDEHYRRFAANVPQLIQWDDHEVVNNWFPGEPGGAEPQGYTETDVNKLADFAYQAWREWQPVQPTEAADGRLYRKISYGPLLDVFVLDMRSYKDRTPTRGPRPMTPASSATSKPSGSSTASPRRGRCGRSSRTTCR